jgi:hypothetical protein
MCREVVIGANSKVWRAAGRNPAVAARFRHVISHGAVPDFQFGGDDRVWIFAYSRRPDENSRLLATVRDAGVREVVYVSTATANVTRYTNCYGYPRVKRQAEDEARKLRNARVLVFGLVVTDVSEVPAGRRAVTWQRAIEDFVLNPQWPSDGGREVRLFEPVNVAFTRAWERAVHRVYDSLQWRVRRWPCILRPIDLMLRVLGIRWYGYVNLSDKIWFSTTSSSARD